MGIIDGTGILSNQIEATKSKGLLALGPGPWDGTSAGSFAGSALGTVLAENVQSVFAGNLVDLQAAGASKFKVDANGNLLVGGVVQTSLAGLPTTGTLVTHLTSATVAAGSNDVAGTITLVTDATGIAINQTLFVLSFAGTHAAAPKAVNLINSTPGADSTSLFSGTYAPITISATGFSVVNLGHLLTASGTFTLMYQVTF